MLRRRPVLPGLALLILATAASARSDDPFRHAREQFVEAYTQATTTSNDQQRPDREELRDYPLYPYLQAARIKRALAESASSTPSLGTVDQRAQTFATYYEREPVGRDLRRAWLTSLAERQQWPTFLEQYRDDVADDALQCLSFTARIELDRTDAPRRRDCRSVADAAQPAGVRTRVRLAARAERTDAGLDRAARAPCAGRRQRRLRATDRRPAARGSRRSVAAVGGAARTARSARSTR